jgi:hypothetical protein
MRIHMLMCDGKNSRHCPGIFSLVLLLLMLAGCATPQTEQVLRTAGDFPRPVELVNVPFFPQEDHQCGPAALATVLNSSGLNVTPEELVPQVYVPDRKGSFQFELLASIRRHDRIPYVLRPQLEVLMREVAAGNPVLVLQNLGLAAIPFWHYAVVVGFDLEHAEITLRSGRDKRYVMSMRTFEHTWSRSDYWAIVVLPADVLPQTAEELPYLKSVLVLEKLNRWQIAATAYGSALQRWPQSLGAQMGLGNSRYVLGELGAAESAFRAAIQAHPQAAAAYNNLAQTLADQQRWNEAEQAAEQAVAIGGNDAEIFAQTLARIKTRTN